MNDQKKVRLTLTRSLNGRLKKHILCANGLGLRKNQQSSEVLDTPENRGMIKKISYMLTVEGN